MAMTKKTICGKATVDGTPCQNGPGCAVDHQQPAVAAGPGAAAVVVPGPDPLSGPPPAGAGLGQGDDPDQALAALEQAWERAQPLTEQSFNRVLADAIQAGRDGHLEAGAEIARRALRERDLSWRIDGIDGIDDLMVFEPILDRLAEKRRQEQDLADAQQAAAAALLTAAADPSTPAETLADLAAHPHNHVQRRVARNTSTPAGTLADLAARTDVDVRREVARNTSTPAGTLADLAADTDVDVRREVARNRSTPAQSRAVLAEDPHPGVRWAAAGW